MILKITFPISMLKRKRQTKTVFLPKRRMRASTKEATISDSPPLRKNPLIKGKLLLSLPFYPKDE
jgi:hypothetical protein